MEAEWKLPNGSVHISTMEIHEIRTSIHPCGKFHLLTTSAEASMHSFTRKLQFTLLRPFLTVYSSRFELTPSGGSGGGLIISLHLVGGGRVPNGITSGWDQESKTAR